MEAPDQTQPVPIAPIFERPASAAPPKDAFMDTWAYPKDVEKALGAGAHIVHNTNRRYNSGRPVIEVSFHDRDRNEIDRRDGMELQNRKGEPYYVCRRNPPPPRERLIELF